MDNFDRFRKEDEPHHIANKGIEHSELYTVVDSLKKNQRPTAMRALSQVLHKYVTEGTWIPMPTVQDAKGYRLRIVESRGNAYVAMYSDNSEVKAPGSILMTDINKLLDPVFENTEIAGIVIDPDTTSLCLDKGFLLKCILHGYLPEQNNAGSPQKDWGVGIPKYTEADVMTKGQMLNFAMHAVLDNGG